MNKDQYGIINDMINSAHQAINSNLNTLLFIKQIYFPDDTVVPDKLKGIYAITSIVIMIPTIFVNLTFDKLMCQKNFKTKSFYTYFLSVYAKLKMNSLTTDDLINITGAMNPNQDETTCDFYQARRDEIISLYFQSPGVLLPIDDIVRKCISTMMFYASKVAANAMKLNDEYPNGVVNNIYNALFYVEVAPGSYIHIMPAGLIKSLYELGFILNAFQGKLPISARRKRLCNIQDTQREITASEQHRCMAPECNMFVYHDDAQIYCRDRKCYQQRYIQLFNSLKKLNIEQQKIGNVLHFLAPYYEILIDEQGVLKYDTVNNPMAVDAIKHFYRDDIEIIEPTHIVFDNCSVTI